MSTSTKSRVDAGVPSGGEFTAHSHSDKVPALGAFVAPSTNEDFVAHRLGEIGFADHMTRDEILDVTHRLNESRDFRDENITAVADQVHLDTAGYTLSDAVAADEGVQFLRKLGHDENAEAIARLLDGPCGTDLPEADIFAVPVTSTRLHVLKPAREELPDGKTTPVLANDPRLIAGQVFDKVMSPDGTVFHRRRPGVFAGEPYTFRIQASRPMREDEKLKLAGILGYAYASEVRGEGFGMPESDSPYSFVVSVDTTKSRSDDIGHAMQRFEEALPEMILEGSAPRKTDRKGPIGSRLVEGFNEPGLGIELYYDDVYED